MKKKLIEVALPLEAINRASAREKSIRHGHPSTLHLWWARRPLATCRAVLFAQLVDDPSSHPDKFPTEEAQEKERQRLFRIIEDLVKWENSNNEQVLERARAEIKKSCGDNPPPVLDPFCGGGSIPLEAQRLGLEAHASDLNPVAVLITKALIEIPPKFANRPPVHPTMDKRLLDRKWQGAQGLAEDVRYYGQWMRDEAEKQIGHLYPKVKLPKEFGGGEATVIAWLWARTVKCPNPACGVQMPLAKTFWLSTKKGKQAWVEPGVDRKATTLKFTIKTGDPERTHVSQIGNGTGLTSDGNKKVKATFKCIVCNEGIAKGDYIDKEANGGRLRTTPLAIVAVTTRGRVYVPFDEGQLAMAVEESPRLLDDPSVREKVPSEPAKGTFASNAQGRIYGFKTFADYFTPRQLVALTTFSGLVSEARERAIADAKIAGMADNEKGIAGGGSGATAYGEAVATYLALGVDRLADRNSTICSWTITRDNVRNTFARQAIPMTWDFAEANPFSDSTGNFLGAVGWITQVVDCSPKTVAATASQLDASSAVGKTEDALICTDPPYYDNVAYADLSDFFYVWLRRSLGQIYPDLFSTLLVPKSQELVATPFRFGGNKKKAEIFFEEALGKAFTLMNRCQNLDYPLTVYYAFKQAESMEDEEGNGSSLLVSTGWETMLEGLLGAGFQITGTWPMRSELSNRPVALGTNALASSIVLVCRHRAESVPLATRREFAAALKRELPHALKNLQRGNIAPVDLAQASIGPGMAVFSRYNKVLEADGSPMRVRTALTLINQTLDEILAEQEGEFDADTRWAVAWFEQQGFTEGQFGMAETLSKAKNTAVDGLREAGIVHAGAGKVRLLKRDELTIDWDPVGDKRLTVWEACLHLIRALETEGESGAAQLLAKLGGVGEEARDLSYRLYIVCERKKWAQEALAFNSLVVSWPEIVKLVGRGQPGVQETLL